jgi:Domain of unknown function (DUF4279)
MYPYIIELDIEHPNMDPDFISRVLDLKPNLKAKRFEDICKKDVKPRTPGDVPTHWNCRLHDEPIFHSDASTLVKVLHTCIEKVQPHRDLLKRIKSEGGSVAFRIFWDTYPSTTGFDNETVELCDALGIGFQFVTSDFAAT